MNGPCLWAGGGCVVLGLRPRHQAKLMNVRNKVQHSPNYLPPCTHTFLSGITTLLGPRHFSDIWQYERKCKLLSLEKVDDSGSIFASLKPMVRCHRSSCLPLKDMGGWVRGGRRSVYEVENPVPRKSPTLQGRWSNWGCLHPDLLPQCND